MIVLRSDFNFRYRKIKKEQMAQSGRGRPKNLAWKNFERDCKILRYFDEARTKGEKYSFAVQHIAHFLGISRTEVKRARARWRRKDRVGFLTISRSLGDLPPDVYKLAGLAVKPVELLTISIGNPPIHPRHNASAHADSPLNYGLNHAAAIARG
jgi:hypothetical protein